MMLWVTNGIDQIYVFTILIIAIKYSVTDSITFINNWLKVLNAHSGSDCISLISCKCSFWTFRIIHECFALLCLYWVTCFFQWFTGEQNLQAKEEYPRRYSSVWLNETCSSNFRKWKFTSSCYAAWGWRLKWMGCSQQWVS